MVRVGIIGVGNISNTHITQLLKVSECKITAICDIDPNQLKKVGDRLGLDDAHRFSDYKELINCADVDAVEVCTPNYLHVPMAIDVVKAGKPVEVEKPLACNLEQTRALEAALKQNPVPNMMCFSYRFRPATRYAKWIIDQGMIGDIVSVDVAYLKSSAFMADRRLEWRFVKEYAGTGVLGDLGVHLIDMTRYLVGDLKSVCGDTEIVIKERKKLDSDEIGKVETDDYCAFMAKVGDNVHANFTITRCALGNANTIKYDIYGTEGVISFNLNNPDVLNVCVGEIDKECNGIHTVKVPARFARGQEQTFIDVASGKTLTDVPVVADGVDCQRILDAILLSTEQKRWIDVDSL